MKPSITTRDNQTVLQLKPGRPRPPRTSAERWRDSMKRRLEKGLCQQCGRRRKTYKHRCDKCQKKERLRHRRAYGNNFPPKTGDWRPRIAQMKANLFVKRLLQKQILGEET